MKNTIARFISIAGHPALLMPLAAMIASSTINDQNVKFLSVGIAVFFAILIFVYSQIKTRTGQWKHVDASVKKERKELNLTACIILFVSAAMLALLKVLFGIVLVVGLSGAIVLVSHFFSRIAKPSLHVSFAIFAACLTWPNEIAVAALFIFTVFIGWARLYLDRHTWLDLILGAILGFFAGLCFQALIRIS
jgi:membrane-associated phospholipid phosphatase